MLRYLFILSFTFFLSANCSQVRSDSDKIVLFENKRELLSGVSYKAMYQEKSQITYIIFGVYCGECMGRCATMFRYNCNGNMNTFFIDDNDTYFKNRGEIIFKKYINTHENLAVAQSIIDRMPKQLLKAGPWKRFGCPDCTDGCGIYLEVGQEQGVKQFYIDYQTEQLTEEMKEFAEFLKTAIAKLKEQNRIKR